MSLEGETAARRFRPEGVLVLVLLYFFLVSISLLGVAFKGLGEGFTSLLQGTVSNPLVGLALGVFVTSIVQSSSLTIATTVALVGSGQLTVEMAVPIVMGANIGTTITNTLVSMAHVPHRPEFRRAVTTGTMHDFFNLTCVIILFPLELATGFLQAISQKLTGLLVGVKAGEMPSPLEFFIKPVVSPIHRAVERAADTFAPSGQAPRALVGALLILVALVMLFVVLTFLVKTVRRLFSERMERLLDRYLFASTGRAITLGLLITAVFQSSSVTTSLMVPLGAAGLVTPEQVLPYMMGANIGTAVKAILAALATARPGAALTIALVHLLFNVTGVTLMLVIPPLRRVPVFLARTMGQAVMRNRAIVLVYAVLVFFVIPGILILLGGLLSG